MAEVIARIVPKCAIERVSLWRLRRAVSFLKKTFIGVKSGDVRACEVDYKRYKNVEFIDCGANLESISCPNCGEEINFSWWGEAMNRVYETHFKEMGVMMPCCNKKTTLGGLKYNAPCSFAKAEIRVLNPQDSISKETIRAIERICKTPFQVIYQRV